MAKNIERIATLEEQTKSLREDFTEQSHKVNAIEKNFAQLTYDVKQIRYALYVMATAMLGQVPTLDRTLSSVLKLIGF